MNTKIYTIEEIRTIATPIAAAHGVKKLSLFGSYARNEASRHSDLDFKIEKGALHTLWQLCALDYDLERAFDKPIDLITDYDAEFTEKIRNDEVLLYDAGKP